MGKAFFIAELVVIEAVSGTLVVISGP